MRRLHICLAVCGLARLALRRAWADAGGFGPEGRRAHYEAPPARRLGKEMERFLAWVNAAAREPALIRAGLGHLWFVALHPFDDGNGRIACAIGDLLLARADRNSQRSYSLSAQLHQAASATGSSGDTDS